VLKFDLLYLFKVVITSDIVDEVSVLAVFSCPLCSNLSSHSSTTSVLKDKLNILHFNLWRIQLHFRRGCDVCFLIGQLKACESRFNLSLSWLRVKVLRTELNLLSEGQVLVHSLNIWLRSKSWERIILLVWPSLWFLKKSIVERLFLSFWLFKWN
jgi:hypothetical protein